ncbi:hypothetical protein ACU8V7_00365 [Zobellia nedashkovskayae]
MKKHYKLFRIILILILTLVSCKNSKTEKNNLVYENGIEKIAIEIVNGQDFFVYNELTKTNFVVTNIDPINLAIFGPGIKILGTNKDKTAMRTEINVPSGYLDKDTLTIKVRYGEGYKKGHDFYIPVRKPE